MGSKQLGFGDYEQTTAKKRTRRERFLAEMEVVVPWKALIDLIEPHYPKATSKGGRPPYPLETMLRIHLLQQWYDLSDPAMEDALIEVPTMRRFAGIELISDRIPDERDHDPGVPAPVGEARARRSDLWGSKSAPQGERHGHEAGHHHRCNLDRGS
jgi:hypothetical protein